MFFARHASLDIFERQGHPQAAMHYHAANTATHAVHLRNTSALHALTTHSATRVICILLACFRYSCQESSFLAKSN